MAMDEEKRQARFARWEKIGLERIKSDLLTGGHKLVGGTQEVRELAWEWVQQKEREQKEREEMARGQQDGSADQTKEVLQLKPTIWGVGIDLKELWRRLRRKRERRTK